MNRRRVVLVALVLCAPLIIGTALGIAIVEIVVWALFGWIGAIGANR